MGSCLSKKSTCSDPPQNHSKTLTLTLDPIPTHQTLPKKSVFVIKHRNSTHRNDTKTGDPGCRIIAPPERRRLGRSSSASRAKNQSFDLGNDLAVVSDKVIEDGDYCEGGDLVGGSDDAALADRGRWNSDSRGTERSFDLDNQTLISDKGKGIENGDDSVEDMSLADRISRHRRSRSSSSAGRRRSPRASRSPSRRSESPVSGTTSASSNIGANSTNVNTNRPAKMVSVPASEHMINRISVRRNVGDPSMMGRSGSSPRARSPAKQALSLSRSSSRRAEYSPYRRNALGDIDQNCSGNDALVPYQKTYGENLKSNGLIAQGTYSGSLRSIATEKYQMNNEGEGSRQMSANIAGRTEGSRAEKLRQQTATSRSSRLFRDLDLNPDPHLAPAPSSYTALLLEDIQNFHQKNVTPAISLPPCVSKAQSIVDAVADLNSGTRSNFYAALSEQRMNNSTSVPFNNADDKYCSPVSNDLADPSFHKYVTVKRGTMDVEEDEEEESSGSNSFVSGTQHWVSSSSWEPNSSDSTCHYSSSRSNARGDKKISMSSKEHTCSISESDQQMNGIGRYRVGSDRS